MQGTLGEAPLEIKIIEKRKTAKPFSNGEFPLLSRHTSFTKSFSLKTKATKRVLENFSYFHQIKHLSPKSGHRALTRDTDRIC